MAQFGEFLLNHWLLASSFVVILVLIIAVETQRKVLGFSDIKPQEAVRLINQEDAVILDVRDEQEFSQGHIINALHIPLGVLDKRLQELEPYKDQPIVVYCRTGQRSAEAGVLLRKQGFNKIHKLGGGVLAWQGADLPLTQKKA